METTKLTVRVRRELLEQAKQYARENETTLTRLIDAYFRQLADDKDPLTEAPIVRRLSGSLSQDVSVKDYYNHLEEKYGG
jgi:hypothetical protein